MSEVKVFVYVCISMQIFVRDFLLGVRLGMKTNVVVVSATTREGIQCEQLYAYVYGASESVGSTVDVTTNSTVMLSFLHWVIPQYIVLAPTTVVLYTCICQAVEVIRTLQQVFCMPTYGVGVLSTE